MIISSSNIGMSSERTYSSQQQFTQSVSSVSVNASTHTNTNNGSLFSGNGSFPFQKQNLAENLRMRFSESQGIKGSKIKEQRKALQQIQKESINHLLKLLFGKELSSPQKLFSSGESSFVTSSAPTISQMQVDTTTYYREEECTSFQTTGTVVTQDGREIQFNLEFAMSRSFVEYASQRITVDVPLCDPLVINLNTNIAEVSDQKFMFDIDADGTMDHISQLKSGSGFLALDKNGDGVINDGNELFGTKSGDGFADLRAYDSDGNGWIDEADEIFDKLLIWTKDSSGKDVLCGLAKAGVGAIYLGNVGTKFSLNDKNDNSTNAVIQKTGIFLYENGNAGTIQHVDFAK